MTLRRNVRISALPIYDGADFAGYDIIQNDEKKLTNDNSYFIYMKNVNLKSDGTIVGRYLGQASNNLIDGYCRNAVYSSDAGYKVDGAIIKTARMVAIKNDGDKQVIIILLNRE